MIVYILISGGGAETVWTTPQAALAAKERLLDGKSTAAAYVAVRPTDSEEPTPESKIALAEYREMERVRHNAKAEEIRRGQ